VLLTGEMLKFKIDRDPIKDFNSADKVKHGIFQSGQEVARPDLEDCFPVADRAGAEGLQPGAVQHGHQVRAGGQGPDGTLARHRGSRGRHPRLRQPRTRVGRYPSCQDSGSECPPLECDRIMADAGADPPGRAGGVRDILVLREGCPGGILRG
jgi:hypothetical protein